MTIHSPTVPRTGQWVDGSEVLSAAAATAVCENPATGEPLAAVEQATDDIVERAVRSARRAAEQYREQPRKAWADTLHQAAAALEAAGSDIADLIVTTIGKPRRAARFEVSRGPRLLRYCGEEVARFGGESIPVDAVDASAHRQGMVWREPLGVVLAITPFNAPVNLMLQKVAPALAAGNAVIVKPAPGAALVTSRLARALSGAVPPGLLTVLHGGAELALRLAGDPGVDAVSLTGGLAAGRAVHAAAGPKPVTLELGAASPNVVLAGADLAAAAGKISQAAFEASGQQCVSAQRIYVQQDVYPAFLDAFVAAARALVTGDPADERTDIGSMVSAQARDRVTALVDDAEKRGATVLLDGRPGGMFFSPTILTEVPEDARIWHEEVFGPVVAVAAVSGVDEAIARCNDAPGLLQASCFTSDLSAAFRAAERIRAGAVWINEATRYRTDNYPFGGSGASGIGREGAKYAMESFSRVKFVGFHP